jgi:hypothetical protein
MKNFLNQLATDNTDIAVELIVDCIVDNGIPDLKIFVNGQELYNNKINQTIYIDTKIPLLDSLNVQIELCNKLYSENKETAVIIKSFKVDNCSITENHNALINYDNDQGVDYRGFYLGFNGTWTFQINQPFYRWRHYSTGQGWLLEPALLKN